MRVNNYKSDLREGGGGVRGEGEGKRGKNINKFFSIYQLKVKVGRSAKNCDLGLEKLPSACGLERHFQDLGHSFALYGPTSLQITHVYF